MCEHHHAAKHILCSQCDMLVALPRLEHGQKAACPRCGTTLTVAWDAPRQRPTAYALAALFMLLLSNLFPFVNMNVAGVTSEITLLEIPGVLFSEDYASLGTFFLLFVQLVPAFCLITILLLVNRGITGPFKRATGTGAFSTQNLGNGGDFPRGCAGQFRETDGLRQHWGRQQLSPLVFILCPATARFSVC